MKNGVCMKMLYYPCNNKSLADAAGIQIIIDDFGETKVCVGNVDFGGAQLPPTRLAAHWGPGIGTRSREAPCTRTRPGSPMLSAAVFPGWGGGRLPWDPTCREATPGLLTRPSPEGSRAQPLRTRCPQPAGCHGTGLCAGGRPLHLGPMPR